MTRKDDDEEEGVGKISYERVGLDWIGLDSCNGDDAIVEGSAINPRTITRTRTRSRAVETPYTISHDRHDQSIVGCCGGGYNTNTTGVSDN